MAAQSKEHSFPPDENSLSHTSEHASDLLVPPDSPHSHAPPVSPKTGDGLPVAPPLQSHPPTSGSLQQHRGDGGYSLHHQKHEHVGSNSHIHVHGEQNHHHHHNHRHQSHNNQQGQQHGGNGCTTHSHSHSHSVSIDGQSGSSPPSPPPSLSLSHDHSRGSPSTPQLFSAARSQHSHVRAPPWSLNSPLPSQVPNSPSPDPSLHTAVRDSPAFFSRARRPDIQAGVAPPPPARPMFMPSRQGGDGLVSIMPMRTRSWQSGYSPAIRGASPPAAAAAPDARRSRMKSQKVIPPRQLALSPEVAGGSSLGSSPLHPGSTLGFSPMHHSRSPATPGYQYRSPNLTVTIPGDTRTLRSGANRYYTPRQNPLPYSPAAHTLDELRRAAMPHGGGAESPGLSYAKGFPVWPDAGTPGATPSRKGRRPWALWARARWWSSLANHAVLQKREARRLLILIFLNVAYFCVEMLIGLFTGRVELVSDAFHLSFGCCVLLVSLAAMVWGRARPDSVYTYGYGRLDVLAAFTNAIFLLFLSFSLCVEALHAFVEDEAEHKHYLTVSAVANLIVNLLGVLFFRRYARVHMVYKRPQDINQHAIFLHVVSDSIRSAGVVLASWFLAVGVGSAETICLGLVSAVVLFLTLPLLKVSGGLLLQTAPAGVPEEVLHKCMRQANAFEGVEECYDERFWAMAPGYIVGTLTLRVKDAVDEQQVLQHVHSVFSDIGVSDLTVQIDVGDRQWNGTPAGALPP